MNNEPNYFAIIPASVRYDKRLVAKAVLLYGEISALTNKEGYCWASDGYFAELYQVNRRNIQRWLNSLEECGYIKRESVYNGKQIVERKIYLLTKSSVGVPTKSSHPTDKNVVTPTDKNVVENNTIFNNTHNNTKEILSSSDEPDRIPYSEIIDHLNQKANTKYRATTSKTKTLIKARWNEGNRLEDFKRVIDNKCSEWLGKDMAKYLRPETLFGTKFEGYLNERAQTKSKAQSYAERYWGDL